jgi:hypothetical protein
MISKEDARDIMKSFIGNILVILLISLGIGNYLYTIFYESSNVIIFHDIDCYCSYFEYNILLCFLFSYVCI